MEYILEKLKEVYERSLRMKKTMCFCRNKRFYDYENPFITAEDVQVGRFIVRDREFDKSKWLQNEAKYRWAGITEWACYDVNSKIIQVYESLEEMARDDWYPEKWKW